MTTPEPPPDCRLEPGAVPDRAAAWARLLAEPEESRAIEGGLELRFPPSAAFASKLARLAGQEKACCDFFEFTIQLTPAEVIFQVRAPAEAAELVAELFGRPA